MANTFPATIRAGMTTDVVISSDESVVKLVANATGTVLTMTAVNNADGTHTFTFPAATAYTAGQYTFVVYSELVGVKTTILTGRFKLLPSLAAGDPRSQAEIILDAINATLAGRASSVQRAVTVGDKTINYMSHAELIAFRAVYEDIVEQEQDEINGTNSQAYYSEFTRA